MSADSVDSHRKFKEKFDLPFTLLADTEHQVSETYGVWQEKTNFGKTYWGIVRTTYLIDRAGRIARVFEKVKPEGHPDEVAEAVTALAG